MPVLNQLDPGHEPKLKICFSPLGQVAPIQDEGTPQGTEQKVVTYLAETPAAGPPQSIVWFGHVEVLALREWNHLKGFMKVCLINGSSQGQNLASIVLVVPSSLGYPSQTMVWFGKVEVPSPPPHQNPCNWIKWIVCPQQLAEVSVGL